MGITPTEPDDIQLEAWARKRSWKLGDNQ